MALNTRIRGAQINLADTALDVSADSFAFYDATDGVIKRDLISDFVSNMIGEGLSVQSPGVIKLAEPGINASHLDTGGGTPDDVLTLGTGDNIHWTTLPTIPDEVFVDDVTIEFLTGNILAVKNAGIGSAKLDAGVGTAGQVLTKGTGDTMVWATPSTITEDYIQEAEIITENVSVQMAVTGYAGDFDITYSPVLGSIQVFLNGLLQEEGTGKDYTVNGTGNKVISFATDPIAGDIVIVHYVRT